MAGSVFSRVVLFSWLTVDGREETGPSHRIDGKYTLNTYIHKYIFISYRVNI